MKDTRSRIVERAFILFLKKGFKAVRLTDIEHAAGITKGTFYYHFASKEEVLKEGVYEYYRLLNLRRTAEFEQIKSLRGFIDQTVRNIMEIDQFSAKNFTSDIPEILCLSLLVEVLALYPAVKQIVNETKTSWLSKVELVIQQAKQSGEIKNDVDTLILAKNLLNVSVGVINYVVLRYDMKTTLSAIRLQYEQLYSLVKRS